MAVEGAFRAVVEEGRAEASGVGDQELLSGVPAAPGMTTGGMVEPDEIASVVRHRPDRASA